MPDPDWLIKARSEGRVTERRASPSSLQPSLTRVAGDGLVKTRMHISEEEFQERVVTLARSHGWKVAHFPKRKMLNGSTPYYATAGAYDAKGWPDLCFGKSHYHFFAELKVGSNVASEEQCDWLDVLDGYLWYPTDWEEIVRVITVDGPAEALQSLRDHETMTDDGCPHPILDHHS